MAALRPGPALLGVILTLGAGAPAAGDSLPPLPEPGEVGSHARYVEALHAEQKRIADELLARYERRIAEAPDDRVAALERCRFLDVGFYDPETEENPREEERAACIDELETRFASDPEARVYAIEQRWGEEALEAGENFLADPPLTARPEHLAAVHRHLARQSSDDAPASLKHAEQAMKLDPSLDLRLLVARKRIEAKDRKGARAVLSARLLETQEAWELEQKGELLTELGACDAAVQAFREAERRGKRVQTLDHAHALACAGYIEHARAIYAEDREGWYSEETLRARFEFELEHGSAKGARAAYDALRERNPGVDPIGRYRLALLFAHPGAAWKATDAAGLVALMFALLALAALPALFILPVHAIGLRRSPGVSWVPRPLSPFGLRQAWIASAGLLLAGALIAFLPLGGRGADAGVANGIEIGRATLLSALASVAVVVVVLRGKIRGLLTRGRWSWARVIGGGVLLALAVQLLGGGLKYLSGGIPPETPSTRMIESVQRSFGVPASLVGVALLIPFAEEVVFRGVLLSAFASRLRTGWANVLQAALFGLAHAHPILTPLFFVFGIVAGRFTRVSGSLRTALLAHVLNNTLACIALASRMT